MRYPPLYCPICKESGVYYGRLRFPEDPPIVKCPHHPDQPLLPVDRRKRKE